MGAGDIGRYSCVAANVAGVSTAHTDLTLTVDPPQVTVAPENVTLDVGGNVTVSCTAASDALLLKYQLTFNGTNAHYVEEISTEPNMEGLYVFNKTIYNASEQDNGIYSCVASNRGGESTQSTKVTVQNLPTAQIVGVHSLTRLKDSATQLVCLVDHAARVLWTSPNGTTVRDVRVSGGYTDMLDVRVTQDGVWSCTALRGEWNASDAVEISVLIKPEVSIEGPKNITIVNGTQVALICIVKAKPAPRILWHRETEEFLNNTITSPEPNVYRSVLTLDSCADAVNGTYFCFGENSEGIHHDSAVVNVRRQLTLLDGFQDKTVQLYSQISLPCRVDSSPPPTIRWYHNGTRVHVDDNDNDNVRLSESNDTLYVARVGFGDLGRYRCEVGDGYEQVKVEGSVTVTGLESPLLSKEPIRIVTQKGKSVILTCRVIKSSPHPTFTWQFLKEHSAANTTLPSGVVPSADNSELIVSIVEVHHWGVYRCIAENVLGRDVYDVLLIVQYPPQLSEHSATSDRPLLVRGGESVRLSCDVTGMPPPLVVWSKDGRPVPYSDNVHLTDGPELVIEAVTVHDSGMYTCNATSPLGAVHRNVTVIVYVPPTIVPPASPSVECVEGAPVELACPAQANPPPRVWWTHNGADVAGAGARRYVDQFGLRFVANVTDFGEYECVASNEYGNASITYTVRVWVRPYVKPLASVTDVRLGANVSLECDVVGFPIPTVVWEFRHEMLTENTTRLSFNEFGSLNVKNITAGDKGFYSCVAENIAGFDKQDTYVRVNEPARIIRDGMSPYVASTRDAAVRLACRATGAPPPRVAWTGPHPHRHIHIHTDGRLSVDASGSLTIRAPTAQSGGDYTCTATNAFGADNYTVTLLVYSPPDMQADSPRPNVTVIRALEGTALSVDCPAATDNRTVKWYKDAKLISNGTLHFANVSRANASTVACVATDALGSTVTNVRVDVEWPPALAGVGRDVRVLRGEDAILDCVVDANPPAKIEWWFNSTLVVGGAWAGAGAGGRLRLDRVRETRAGAYRCVATNTRGTVEAEYTLQVLVPPFISEFDSLEVQLLEGADATLECNARGIPRPTVSWVYNNSAWQQQGTSLRARNVTENAGGVFVCAAVGAGGGGGAGGAARLAYHVRVASPARVRSVTAFRDGVGEGETVDDNVEVALGSRVRLSCVVTGSPPPAVRWVRGGDVVGGGADLLLGGGGGGAEDGGQYYCVVGNEAGVDEKMVTVEVLERPSISMALGARAPAAPGAPGAVVDVLSGQPLYLHCHPLGTPPPTLYWFKDDLPLRLFDSTMESTDYGEVLVSRAATVQLSGNYTCVARNKVGEASVTYSVRVLVPPPTPKEAVKAVSTRVGRPLVLTCPLLGSPPPTVAWFKLPYTEITNETPRVTMEDDNVTLIINATEVTDSGVYSCVMTNKVGTSEVSFDVTILQPPTIAGGGGAGGGGGGAGGVGAEEHEVAIGRSVVLKCDADGNPPPKIIWLKDTQHVSSNLSTVQHALGGRLLAVWRAGVRDAGEYVCVAESSAGTDHRRYRLHVRVPGKWTAWSSWSYCNVTCGAGSQYRTRVCRYVDEAGGRHDAGARGGGGGGGVRVDRAGCRGAGDERRGCRMPPCEDESASVWGRWGRWGACSVTCDARGGGGGTQVRARSCRGGGGGRCQGDNVQIRRCPDLPECDTSSVRQPTDSEVVDSLHNQTNAITPETTSELYPAVVDPLETDAEGLNIKSDDRYPVGVYEVPVSDNLDGSEPGGCGAGFRRARDGTCEDIDECVFARNMCHSTQRCVNTPGAYRCACAQGYFALGAGQRCLDVNECTQEIDGCEYACVNTAGGYVCACPRPLRLHADRHRCVPPPTRFGASKPDGASSREYLGAAIELPARYINNRNGD